MCFLQLRFEEGNWIPWTEKSGRYRLYQHYGTVSLLHQSPPKGVALSFLPVPIFSEPSPRLFTKSQQKINFRQGASYWHSNASSITCRPPINLLVCTALHLDESGHELTKWFDWKPLNSFLQRDVQEFNRVLLGELESSMKVRRPLSRHLDNELLVLSGHMYFRVHTLRVQSENSSSER